MLDGSQIAQAEVRPGDILAGKYCIERRIGEGGMGMVVVARHLELDEPVAIKFLLPEALGNSEAAMRFAREARASVKIKSEHVARTLRHLGARDHAASSAPKGSQEPRNKPKSAGGVTDFGGRLY